MCESYRPTLFDFSTDLNAARIALKTYRVWEDENGLASGDAWSPSDVTVLSLVNRLFENLSTARDIQR